MNIQVPIRIAPVNTTDCPGVINNLLVQLEQEKYKNDNDE